VWRYATLVWSWSWGWHEADSSSRDTDPFFCIVVLPKKNTGPLRARLAENAQQEGRQRMLGWAVSHRRDTNICSSDRPACRRLQFCARHGSNPVDLCAGCFLMCFNTVALVAKCMPTKHAWALIIWSINWRAASRQTGFDVEQRYCGPFLHQHPEHFRFQSASCDTNVFLLSVELNERPIRSVYFMVFWVVESCSPLTVRGRFGGTCCLHLQPRVHQILHVLSFTPN
jgi:hypothetical protein